MIVNFKKLHPGAVTPTKAHESDAGFDLTAVSERFDRENDFIEYGCGVAVSIPPGFVGLLFPRSSTSKYDLTLCNSVGVLDSGFLGEVCFRYRETIEAGAKRYQIGDRVGQLVIMPLVNVSLHEVGSLQPSERGTSGWGDSGR